MGTLSFCDADGEMLSAIRIGRMPEHKKATLKRTLVAELSAILAQRPDLKLVKLADGANDNRTFLTNDLPTGTELVDFWHACEHLNKALAAVHGDGSVEARERFSDMRSVLKEVPDGVERVIRALAYLHKKHPDKPVILATLKFFRKRRHRMRYQEARARVRRRRGTRRRPPKQGVDAEGLLVAILQPPPLVVVPRKRVTP